MLFSDNVHVRFLVSNMQYIYKKWLNICVNPMYEIYSWKMVVYDRKLAAIFYTLEAR